MSKQTIVGERTVTASLLVDYDTARGRALAPVLVYVAFLAAIVSSLGAPLVPSLADVYSVSIANAQWSLTITLLAGTVLLPIIGYLGDGRRRMAVLQGSLVMLAVGSVIAALPVRVFALLLIGRAMQGVGLALVPLTMSVARDHLGQRHARATVALLSVTVTVGVALGYPLTGVLTEYLNFHAAFWVAAGLTVIAIGLCQLVVPKSSHRSLERFDPIGTILLSVGTAGLVFCISEGEEWGWGSTRWLGLSSGSIVVLAAWAWFGARAPNPIVDLRQLRNKVVLSANVAAVLMGAAVYTYMAMTIRFVQTPTMVGYGLGESVTVSGFVLVPMSVAGFISNKIITRVSERVPPARLLPISPIGFLAALVLFVVARDNIAEILVGMAVAGLSVGASFAVLPRMIVAAVTPEETARALSLNQVLKTLGQTLGSALSATVLSAYTAAHATYPADRGYTSAALIACGIFVVAGLISLALSGPGPAPRSLSDDEEFLVDESGAGQGQLPT